MVSIFMLTGCSKNKKAEEKTTESEPVGMVIDTKEKKRSDVINNILVGRSKMSFNNVNYE